jgi:hypothetical protein
MLYPAELRGRRNGFSRRNTPCKDAEQGCAPQNLWMAASPIVGHFVKGNIASRIPLEDEVLKGISVSRRRTRRYQLSHLTSYQFQEMRGMLAASPGPGHVLDTIGT